MSFEFKPTYVSTFKSSLNTRLQLIALQSTAVLLLGFSIAVPNRLARIAASAVALTLGSVSMVTRREYLKQQWELDIHRQLSSAELQRQLLNQYSEQ